MPKWWPADDCRIYCRPPATGRRPASHRWGACRSSSGHRRGIGRKFCHLQSESGAGRTVSQRRPAGVRCFTFTTWFKVEKIHRWPADVKVGIGEKSTGHRAIYKACDVGITSRSMLPLPIQQWCELIDKNCVRMAQAACMIVWHAQYFVLGEMRLFIWGMPYSSEGNSHWIGIAI